MAFGPLVDAAWLRDHLGDPGLVLVDCRWTLGDPEAGRAGFERGHIPGAAFLDVERDLSAPAAGPEGGRHPLPAPDAFERAASRAGIAADSRVVAYDERGESGAARLWWLLRHFGHGHVAVLDGGLGAWLEASGALESGGALGAGAAPEHGRTGFRARAREDDTIGAEEIERRAGRPGLVLLDARAGERYRGETEPIDAVAGHIPGARNAPFAELAPRGRFLAPDELRARLGSAGAELAAYCGSGVSAATVVLAAEIAGESARLYPGSWSEWSARGLPAERG